MMLRPDGMTGANLVAPLVAAVSSRLQLPLERRRAVAYLASTVDARFVAPRLVAGIAAACREFERDQYDTGPFDLQPTAVLVDRARLAASGWTATVAPPRQRHAHEVLEEAMWRAVEAAVELDRAAALDGRRAWFGSVVASELACTADRRWKAGLRALADSLDALGLDVALNPPDPPTTTPLTEARILPFRRPTRRGAPPRG